MIDILSLTWACFVAQNSQLSIDDAVKIALQNSYSVKNATATVVTNKEKVSEVQGNQGIKVGSSFQHLRYGRPQSGNIGGSLITFIPEYQNTWTNTLQYVIDISGANRSNTTAAKATVDASRSSLNAQENDVKQSVRKAFIQVMRAKNLVGVAMQGRKNIGANLFQSEKKYKEGVVAKIEVDRLRAQLASANSDVIAAENNLQIAKQILNLAMARPIETNFEITDWKDMPVVTSELDSLVKLGQTERPEVKAIEKTVVALGAAKKFAEQGLLPSLNLAVTNQQTLEPVGFNPVREVNTAVLQFNVPIFDSGVSKAKRHQSEQQIEQTKNNLLSLNLAISQEIRSARTNMSNAYARLQAAQEQTELAKEVARIARVRQDAGEGTILEIIDAETQLVQAQTNLINSQFDYLAAYADLQRATGRDDIDAALKAVASQTKKGEKN